MGRILEGRLHLAVLLLLATIVAAEAESATATAPSCSSVGLSLSPCGSYVTGWSAASGPSASCCSAIRGLRQQLQSLSRPDRVSYCNCIKSFMAFVTVNPDHLASLPSKCGISTLGYRLGPAMDCTSVP